MSRGPGRQQRRVIDVLRGAPDALSLDAVARAVLGEREVLRARGRRHVRRLVPAGDVANVRRAVRGLIDLGVVRAVRGAGQRRAAARFALTDRFPWSAPARNDTAPAGQEMVVVALAVVPTPPSPANDGAAEPPEPPRPAAAAQPIARACGVEIRGALRIPAGVIGWERSLLAEIARPAIEELLHGPPTAQEPES